MQLYVIRRASAWANTAELDVTAKKSMKVATEQFPDRIRWIRSYVVNEPDGRIGTFCIYEARDGQSIREHAAAVGMPGDDFYPIVATAVVRPDPAEAVAA